MSTRILLSLLGVLALIPTPNRAQDVAQERFAKAAEVLAKGCLGTGCDFGISDSPTEAAALKTIWDSSQAWTVAYLNANPDIRLERLRTVLLNQHGNGHENAAPVGVFALKLGLYAFFAQYGEMGNVFLVRKQDNRFTVVWDIRDADTTQFPILQAWRLDQANGACRAADESYSGKCGPLFANDIKQLPPDGRGRLRFSLKATYAQGAETTVGGQLSIWSLEDAAPKLQWAKRYAYNFEDVSWQMEGQFLKIRTTDWWHMFFACGTCIGRQMNWTVRIRPDGIDDLGMVPVVPELDAVDELFYRVWKHQPADELATSKVLAVAAKIIAGQQDDEAAMAKENHETVDPNHLFLGMLGGDPKAAVLRKGREVCLVTDDFWAHPHKIRETPRETVCDGTYPIPTIRDRNLP